RGRAVELGDNLGLPKLAMRGQVVQRPALAGVQVRIICRSGVTRRCGGFGAWRIIRVTNSNLAGQAVSVGAVVQDDVVESIHLDVRLVKHHLADMGSKRRNGFGHAVLPALASNSSGQFAAVVADKTSMLVGVPKLIQYPTDHAAFRPSTDLHFAQFNARG